MAKDRIPTSRIARTARVAGLAAGQGARQLGTRAANLTRGDRAREEALERRHLEAAEQIVTALGTMKGAAMKMGQVLSFLDVGLVPEEYREEFQRKLGELRDAAPKVRFSDMRKVIEAELEAPLDEIFDAFDETPIAAASIGQVYRATLPDGRDVAVKVQYPGVAQAVRADMQNLGLILRLLKQIAPGLDARATAEEVRSRIGEELDYELEAQHQRSLARIFRGHPFIVVPDVITSLSRERVIVTEFVAGEGFESLKEADQDTRDRVGEIIFRFFYGSIYHLQHFNADPHPGNYMLMDDGRVAFLDFGMTKQLDKDQIELEIAALEAAFAHDPERLRAALQDLGFVNNPKRVDAERLLEHVKAVGGWYMEDREYTIDSEVVMRAIAAASDPRSEFFDLMRRENLPANEMMGRRMEAGVLAVLGQLTATRNWHRIGREWWFADEPETELGREEWAYFESKGEKRVRKFGARAT